MKPPLVSILMSAYNAEAFVAEAISSILNQTCQNWELLIADDCSTDRTRDVIAEFNDSRIRIYHNHKNLHYLRTRNKLIKHVTGDFITLLDADDYSEPERLDKLLNAFDQDPILGMVGSWVKYIDLEGNPLQKTDVKPIEYEDIKKRIQTENVFTGSSIMVRTEVWKSLGGYRDFFNTLGYEDYDLTSRIVEKYRAINLSESLYVYRQYPDSSSTKDLLYNPFKLHGAELVKLFIGEREKYGTDSLDKGDYSKIINFISKVNMPYINDQSLIYRHLMWTSLNRNSSTKAFKYCLRALVIGPFHWINWKTLLILLSIKMKLIKG